MSRYVLVFLVSMALLGGLVGYRRVFASEQTESGLAEEHDIFSSEEKLTLGEAYEHQRNLAKQRLAKLLEKLPETTAAETVEESQKELESNDMTQKDRVFLQSAMALVKLQKKLTGAEAIEEIWQQLESDEEQIASVQQVLIAPETARARYGEEQGLARVVAIELLDRVA